MLIHVKVHPGSKEDKVVVKNETSLDVFVRDEAEDNKANKKMLALVAIHFQTVQGRIRILTGHHSPSKILDVTLIS